jgi:hypothetical protein
MHIEYLLYREKNTIILILFSLRIIRKFNNFTFSNSLISSVSYFSINKNYKKLKFMDYNFLSNK